MGRDKALLPFLGRPLIVRVIERLAPVADEIIVTTNKPDDYRFLGLPLFPDLMPGRGALGGLYTALSGAAQPLTAVVACDMPFACAGLLAGLRDALIQTGDDLAIPHLEGGLEPFHAVYDRAACLPHIRAAIDADKWRVDAWFSKVKVNFFPLEVVRRYDPDVRCFSNVNTPEELAEAEGLARM
jgi:molybdopterin-guanine dinucleotide biosynthesis protein A